MQSRCVCFVTTKTRYKRDYEYCAGLKKQLNQKLFRKGMPQSIQWKNNNFDSVIRINGDMLMRCISCKSP